MSVVDGRSASGSVAAYHDPDDRYINDNKLIDTVDEEDSDIFLKLIEWYRQVRENQALNRYEQAIDRDFYDGLQLTDAERSELLDRGQAPIVRNYIKSSIDWIIGTEKRTRFDFNVYPRKGDEDAADRAQTKTKLLKYNSDINKAAYARSRAFEDAATVGIGWLEDGIRNDDTDSLQYSRHESWRNVWYDHLSIEYSLSDSRFLFRERWIDMDVAVRMFPDKEAELRASAVSHRITGGTDEDEFYALAQVYMQYDSQGYAVSRSHVGEAQHVNNRRERVKLIECEYRMPRKVKKMRGYDTPLDKLEFDPEDEKHAQAVAEEVVSTYDAMEMRMFYAVMTEGALLQNMPSPYRHNDFRFTPIWGYRRGRDNAPYGVVRNMRDAQRDLNARASKALFMLAVNQIIAEVDSVADSWEEIIDQAADPSGVIRLISGAGKNNKRFELNNDKQLAEEHLMLMDKNVDFLQRSSGVTDENLGQPTNAISGRAIEKKQNEGAVVTFGLFDNLHHSIQLQGEKQLSLIEQFYDSEKTFRIIGESGKADYEDINTPEYDPVSGQVVIKNDMTAEQSDFVINTADFRQTVREAQAEAMLERIGQMPPEMAIQLLDLAVDSMDIPNKEEWLKRIRSMNGHTDPDEKPTPEEQQQAAAAEQAAAEEKRIQTEAIEAKTDRDRAAAEQARAQAEAALAEATENKLEAMHDATEVAVNMLTMPNVAPIVDSLMESAGFVEKVDIGAIDVPREVPQPDPKAVAEAEKSKEPEPTPEPTIDPTSQYNTDSKERVEMEKIKAAKDKPTTNDQPN